MLTDDGRDVTIRSPMNIRLRGGQKELLKPLCIRYQAIYIITILRFFFTFLLFDRAQNAVKCLRYDIHVY